MTEKIQEKEIPHTSGWLAVCLTLFIIGILAIINFAIEESRFLIITAWFLFGLTVLLRFGLVIIKPNESAVYTFFGRYAGSLKKEGFYFLNPLSFPVSIPSTLSQKRLSLKTMTLQNGKQKINDELGNPIEVGIVVVWRIVDTAKAIFGVENYSEFLSIQSDSCLRRIISMYPYDAQSQTKKEKSLRGSNQEISSKLEEEIQKKVNVAGIEILEARITHLAYAPEIALAMLQRQQANAIIDARKLIVEGAVSMIDMAIKEITKNKTVKLNDKEKAHMISNLLVVLCGNKDAQPVVNSGIPIE